LKKNAREETGAFGLDRAWGEVYHTLKIEKRRQRNEIAGTAAVMVFAKTGGVKHGSETFKTAAKKRKSFYAGGACGPGRGVQAGNVRCAL
jgi:hypothetical protein